MLRRTRIAIAGAASLVVGAAAVVSVTVALARPEGTSAPGTPATLAPAKAPAATPAAPDAVISASCVTRWGTKLKAAAHAETSHTARVLDARAGQHACYERIVVDLGAGTTPGYRVQYVRSFHAEGSGKLIRLRGHAVLQITVQANAARSFPGPGHSLTSVAGFHELRQVASGASFEGYTQIGLGVQARKPFRVELLPGPGRKERLVVDVAIH